MAEVHIDNVAASIVDGPTMRRAPGETVDLPTLTMSRLSSSFTLFVKVGVR